jgi:hypothetical protein
MSVAEGGMVEAFLQFVRDFLSNWCADCCAGVLLTLLGAGLLAYWVGKRLHVAELAEQQKQRRQQGIRRAILYLELLRLKEVEPLIEQIPGWRKRIGEEYQIQTPLWFGVIGQGAELAGTVSPDLLSRLATFYQGLVYAKRGVNFLIESWLVESRRHDNAKLSKWQRRFKEMQEEGLEQADRAGDGLAAAIESEIGRLRRG